MIKGAAMTGEEDKEQVLRAPIVAQALARTRFKDKYDARRIHELVDGMSRGDPRAMEAFFTFVDGLLTKKLDRDGEDALMVVVSVVELLLPAHTRLAFAAESEKGVRKPAQAHKRTS
jgi:hypothetical protein